MIIVTAITTLTTTTPIVGTLGRHGCRSSGSVLALLRRGQVGRQERVGTFLATLGELGAGADEGHLVIRCRVRLGLAAGLVVS